MANVAIRLDAAMQAGEVPADLLDEVRALALEHPAVAAFVALDGSHPLRAAAGLLALLDAASRHGGVTAVG